MEDIYLDDEPLAEQVDEDDEDFEELALEVEDTISADRPVLLTKAGVSALGGGGSRIQREAREKAEKEFAEAREALKGGGDPEEEGEDEDRGEAEDRLGLEDDGGRMEEEHGRGE